MITDADCPGFRVTELAEKTVGQPDGWVDPIANEVAEHAAESLLVTVKLYAALLPGYMLGSRGLSVIAGLVCVQGTLPL